MIGRFIKWSAGPFGELAVLGMLSASVFALGIYVGHVNTVNAEAAKQLKQSRQMGELIDKAAEFSLREKAALRDELDAVKADKNTLEERLRDVPLVVPRAPACPPRTAAAREPASPASASSADAAAPERAAAADGLQLTAGAVRLWNDALTGLHVSGDRRGAAARAERAGAANADTAIDEADATGTDLTVDDAWRNHIANASACRADRARLARLTAAVRSQQTLNP